MEAFNADHATGYVGVTLPKLQASYDAGIKNVTIRVATAGRLLPREHLAGHGHLPQVRALGRHQVRQLLRAGSLLPRVQVRRHRRPICLGATAVPRQKEHSV